MSIDVLIIIVFVMGITVGVVGYDLRQRRRMLGELELRERDALDKAKKLQDLHNSVVTQLQAMGDKLSAHDTILKGGMQASQSLVGKRL